MYRELLEVVIDVRTVDFERMRLVTATENLHAFSLRLALPSLPFVAPESAATLP